jgi:dihydrodipicolinate synthase/N-acetylneuraminate lyase
MPKTLHGVLPIVHTPFTADDRIDRATLKREIDWAFELGADGLGTGMVSEILRLTYEERIELTQLIAEYSAGRGAVFAAVGAESGKQALAYSVAAEQAGCDAVMAVPPQTTRLSANGMLDYFRQIADGISLPVIVQDASGYVGQPIPISVCVSLLETYGSDKIVFKPEASPIGPNLSALRDATGGRARIFEGSGGILLIDSYRRGISGTMPGMDLLDGIIQLWKALQAGRRCGCVSSLLPDLWHCRFAASGRAGWIPCRREISDGETRRVSFGPTPSALLMGAGCGNGGRG